jgi:ferredoxin
VERDWQAEIDRWTERFRGVEDPPEPFATALREGWTAEAREALAAEAEAYASAQRILLEQVCGAGMDLVRLDCRAGSCGVCARYCGKAFSLTGETEGLPPPPPMPICPACRHTLNLLTPFFMQSLGLDLEDLIDEAEPFAG